MQNSKDKDITNIIPTIYIIFTSLLGGSIIFDTFPNLHIVFKLVITLIFAFSVTSIILLLFTIPIIGTIFQVISSCFWAEFAFTIIAEFVSMFYPKIYTDNVWIWTIRIISFLIILGFHFATTDSMNINNHIKSKNPKTQTHHYKYQIPIQNIQTFNLAKSKLNDISNMLYHCHNCSYNINNVLNNYFTINEYLKQIDTQITQIKQFSSSNHVDYAKLKSYETNLINNITEFSHMVDLLYDTIQETVRKKSTTEQTTTPNNDNNNFFYTCFDECNNVDDVKKRYRELLKIFHPDNELGSTEKTTAITEAYEQKLTEFS